MELRHLRYFIAVAEHLHFGRAAKELNISQPPLSQQIAQLEEEIGAQLFYRTNRSVRLTPAGEHLFREAKVIMGNLERATTQARKIHNGEAGKLAVGYTGMLSSGIIRILRSFKDRHPDVELILHRMSSAMQNEALKERRIDIGFLCPPIDGDALGFFHLYDYPFVVALPSSHPLTGDPSPIRLSELSGEPFILPPRGEEAGYFDQIIALCNRAGISPDIRQEAEGVTTILSLVAAGIGISIVSTAAAETQREEIFYREIKGADDAIGLYLAWNRQDASPLAERFVQAAESFIQNPDK
ncbi:LysR family transcriptional regulator [Bhargavaea ginsengi]|uniref:LysR family transcriptional regulator n=1 Tax=Bhargavaea ginsengi TaxID=426757 RepID=UPI002040765B|nr:LysR family transcriptional regulator [Bhargavaea ginsengi]MCM3087540.1 LysR family transcriptional regulator [Bhargavaea ginsengi]